MFHHKSTKYKPQLKFKTTHLFYSTPSASFIIPAMNKGFFCIISLAAFSTTLGIGVISRFLPLFAQEHEVNGFWVGMIFAGFGISRGIIMPIVGKASDKRGRKLFVVLGLLVYSIISFFYSIHESVVQLMLVRLVHGFSAGMVMPIVMAYVGDYAKAGKESVTMGALNMVFYLGLATGPLLGSFIHSAFGFNMVFYTMGGLGFLCFFLVLIFLPSDKNLKGKPHENIIPFHSLIKYNFVKAILIIVIVISVILVVFMSFLPSLAERIHIDMLHVGFIMSLSIFLAGIFQTPFGWVADKMDAMGRLIQISIGTCVCMLALLVLPFCPGFYALLGAGALIGMGSAVSMPPLTSFAVEIGHKAGMGNWMGIFTASRSIAFALTPLVCGVVMDLLGINSVFYVLTIFSFFGTLAFLYFAWKRMKGEKI